MKHTVRLMDDAEARPDVLSPVRAGVPLAAVRISLTNFRSYAHAILDVEAAPVVLFGANGTGKTNALEAMSLFSPGRGLRGAKLTELQHKTASPLAGDAAPDHSPGLKGGRVEANFGVFEETPWAISATVQRPDGVWDIGTGLVQATQEGSRPSRVLHLNGAAATSADVAGLLPMLWLTPALDRLFLEGASERRRFLDRLTFGLAPAHARHAARYERAMQERLRLLRDGVSDPAWLGGLEDTMAQEGSEIMRARLDVIEHLNEELSNRGSREGAFPCAQLALQDGLGEHATERDRLRDALAVSRGRDAESGRTHIGPHTSDLDVQHTGKRTPARDCSTGEQKALLVSIVLANAWAQKKRHDGSAPLLLLDEIAAHLDAARRAALFEEILALKTQAWVTGTDKSLFHSLLPHAQCLSIARGAFLRED